MAKTKKANPKKPRTRKIPEYKSFRLSKKIKPASNKPLPGIVRLTKLTLSLLKNNKKLFFGIIGIHLALSIFFSSILSATFDFVSIKEDLEATLVEQNNTLNTAIALLGYVVSAGSNTGDVGGTYRLFFTLISTLALIWAIRQVLSGEQIKIRQAYYQGVYPIVPFILVLFVIGLQLLPFIFGNFLLSTVLTNGLAVSLLEKVLWWLIFLLFGLLSLYMVTSSIFALYISTLPDMTPLRALRSARGLVLHRRLSIALRLLGVPVLTIIFYAAILIPLIIVAPLLAIPIYMAMGSFILFFVNGYVYNLYRSLL